MRRKYSKEQKAELKEIGLAIKDIRSERRRLLEEYRYWKRREYKVKDAYDDSL